MNLPKFKPMRGFCLVQLDPPETISPGGILIPDEEQELSQTGTVKRIGPWPVNKHGLAIVPPFKVGDKVVVNRRHGRTVDGPSKDFKLVEQGRVLAVLT